jgi:hypothetical protein
MAQKYKNSDNEKMPLSLLPGRLSNQPKLYISWVEQAGSQLL